MNRSYAHHHPGDRAARRSAAAEAKLCASFCVRAPRPQPTFAPNSAGERRATRAMRAVYRHMHPERIPR